MTTYIHTATWKTHSKSPDPITKDSRGNEIVVGAKVAYNFSGAVAMGTITAIKNNVWKKPKQGYADWTCDFKLEIEHEDGNISMVKNPNSFIIL